MTTVQTRENPPAGGADELNNSASLASFSAKDTSKSPGVLQAGNDQSLINCRSMRADELRRVTEIDLDRLQVKILTAKAFNRDGLDDDGDEMLRECWRLFQATIAPARTELQRLRGTL